jgi:UTP--glucose-1-phosphate uridylyltransferase
MTNEQLNPNQPRHQRKISSTTEFKELTKKDAQLQLAQELDKLLRTSNTIERQQSEHEFKGFQQLFMKYLQGVGPSVQWEKIEPLPKDAVRSYSSLKAPPKDKIKSMLNQLVVVKLNGGLGMTFDYFLNQKRFKRLNI